MMIIAGTGHRPNKLGGYSENNFNKLTELCELFLEFKKPSKVISGMALGFDLALAQASINQKIPFIAAIPCKNQESRWNINDQLNYRKILDEAEGKIYISEKYNYKCMQERNVWMVNNCNEIVALYDGSDGGTKNCILYAQKKNIQIFNMWDIWKENYL